VEEEVAPPPKLTQVPLVLCGLACHTLCEPIPLLD
jgi:hypothetical protein